MQLVMSTVFNVRAGKEQSKVHSSGQSDITDSGVKCSKYSKYAKIQRLNYCWKPSDHQIYDS